MVGVAALTQKGACWPAGVALERCSEGTGPHTGWRSQGGKGREDGACVKH